MQDSTILNCGLFRFYTTIVVTVRAKTESGHNGINTGDGLPFARLTRKFWGISRPSEKILEKMGVGAAF